jgi:hypothetical protein
MDDHTATVATRALIPFNVEESVTIEQAASTSGKTPRTMRRWCIEHGIGRRIGGTWRVSKVALAMLLEGDHEALAAYRDDGVRAQFEPVARYFRRAGLDKLLQLPGFGAAA